jgi:hypothetical protein
LDDDNSDGVDENRIGEVSDEENGQTDEDDEKLTGGVRVGTAGAGINRGKDQDPPSDGTIDNSVADPINLMQDHLSQVLKMMLKLRN